MRRLLAAELAALAVMAAAFCALIAVPGEAPGPQPQFAVADDLLLLIPVCVIVILMEVASVMENVAKISPALAGSRLLKFFDSEKED